MSCKSLTYEKVATVVNVEAKDFFTISGKAPNDLKEIIKRNAAVFAFIQSPQKLYKAIESVTPGANITKELNVVQDAPISTKIYS